MLDELWRAEEQGRYKYFDNYLTCKESKDNYLDIDDDRYINLNYFQDHLIEKVVYFYRFCLRRYFEKNNKTLSRLEKNKKYYYINFESDFSIVESIENDDEKSELLFKANNYFSSKEEAINILNITRNTLHKIHSEVVNRRYNLSKTIGWRAEQGKTYWYISHIDEEQPFPLNDNRDNEAHDHYIIGNYFETEEEAIEAIRAIRKVLKELQGNKIKNANK